MYDEVEDFQSSGGLGTNHKRADCVEERLKKEPENLKRNIAKEPTFPICWEICVITVRTLVSVMLHVVLFERYRHWNTDRKICPNAKQTIRRGILVTKDHVVRDVVDGESEGVVDHAPQEVRYDRHPEVGQLSDEIARDDIEDDHC